MAKLHFVRIQTLLIIVILFISCNKSGNGPCVTCEKQVSSTSTYVTYEVIEACSEEAVDENRRNGWTCQDYPTGSANEGNRKIHLIAPVNKAIYVPLDISLSWDGEINWYGNDYIVGYDITFDIYLGTDATPLTIVSEGQKELTYTPALNTGTTYYWKVLATNQNGHKSESSISSFTTKPVITFGTFTDSRDGHVYKTINIGSQIWMAENLAYEIPGKQITSDSIWYLNFKYKLFDAWCYYENDEITFKDTYGVLYQWEAAKAASPPGWHLPSVAEWEVATNDYLGGYAIAGGYLKEADTTHWNSPNVGANNLTGFTARPGGHRYFIGRYEKVGEVGFWWTSTEENLTEAWSFVLNYNSSNLFKVKNIKNEGYSIRCIKD